MLTDATKFLRQAPYLILFPGIAIVISAIGFNLLGDGLRESLDPRLRTVTASMALLSVEDLVVRFRTREGTIHAVNGVTFELEEGRAPRPRRRVRLRQERDEPRDHPAPPQARRAHRGRARPLRRPGPHQPAGGRGPGDPRRRHRDDLPGPDDQPEPGPADRGADGRDDPGAPEGDEGRGEEARRRAPRDGGDPEAGGAPARLPAPVLRRDAPARDDRHGARPGAQAAHRRRAHDRARRHDPGAGPRPAPEPHDGAGDGAGAHHARPRRRGRA